MCFVAIEFERQPNQPPLKNPINAVLMRFEGLFGVANNARNGHV